MGEGKNLGAAGLRKVPPLDPIGLMNFKHLLAENLKCFINYHSKSYVKHLVALIINIIIVLFAIKADVDSSS